MQELSNYTGERCYLAVPYRQEVLYLDAMYPADSIELMRSIFWEKEPRCIVQGLGKSNACQHGRARNFRLSGTS